MQGPIKTLLKGVSKGVGVAAFTLCAAHSYAVIDEDTYEFHLTGPSTTTGGGMLQFNGSNGMGGTKGVTVSAWRIENISVSSAVTDGATSGSSNTDVSGNIVKFGDGLGIEQNDGTAVFSDGSVEISEENVPWHGVDNNPENCENRFGACDPSYGDDTFYTGEEFFVFDFGEDAAGNDHKVSLHSFEFGYAREQRSGGGFRNRADATVLSGTGGSSYDLVSALSNNSVLGGGGFELVGNYNNVSQGSEQLVSGGYSRYWAVSTLLMSLLTNPAHFDHLYEGAKLRKLVVKTLTTPPPSARVPLPASALLLGAGLLVLNRRNSKGTPRAA
ncbi:MAG: hypothetical protein AAGI88_20435 [Pseudomonadota bacterium]